MTEVFCGNGQGRLFSAYFECYVVVSLDSIKEAFKMCSLVFAHTRVTTPLPLKRFGQVMVIFSDHDMDSIVSGFSNQL